MSNFYNLEPYTNGKILLNTTIGDIEIELWGKECPKAVRNFLALSMEGYYDNCIFHRVVPDFIVQSGDPTGSGMGGESFYGEPFEVEAHQRLKFNRRGLVGMAHSVNPEEAEIGPSGKILRTNTSQFFITMTSTPELTGNNTLFGRIAGDTIFNALKIQSFETDHNEKPLYPPRIKNIKILVNPFEDIVPRITKAEKKAQAKAKIERQKEREVELAKFNRKKAKKNTGLLSFGDEAEEEEMIPEEGTRTKIKSSHDLLDDPTLSKETSVKQPKEEKKSKKQKPQSPIANEENEKSSKPKVNLGEIRSQHSTQTPEGSIKESIAKTEEQIKKIDEKRNHNSKQENESEEKKSKENDEYNKMLSQYKSKVQKGKKEKQSSTLKRLQVFRSSLQNTNNENQQSDKNNENEEYDYDKDDGFGDDWMNHKLQSNQTSRLEEDQSRRAEDEYDVIDPRAFKRAKRNANPNSDVIAKSGGGSHIRR